MSINSQHDRSRENAEKGRVARRKEMLLKCEHGLRAESAI